jgi:hypothetical protein
MEKSQNHTESSDKAEGVAKHDFDAAATPMERFRSLAQRLMRIRRDEIETNKKIITERRDR